MILRRIQSKPIRTVLRWQVYATAAIALGAGFVWGLHGAFSGLLGGIVNQLADLVYAMLVSGSKIRTAGNTLRTLFRAEAARIVLIIVLLWWALKYYREIMHPVFFLSFVVSVIVFRAAILIKEQ